MSDGIVTETVTDDNPVVEVTEQAPTRLPDDHPLVKTLAQLRAENRRTKEASDKAVQDAEVEVAQSKLETARWRIAAINGLSEADAALLTGTVEQMETLAQRLAGKPACTDIPGDLGRVITIPDPGEDSGPGEASFASFAPKLFKR